VKKNDVKPDATASSPLAIIGIGCLFPQAEDPNTYWSNVAEGIDAITEIPATHWQIADYFDGDPKSPDRTYGRRGGFISPVPFNPMEFNIPPNIMEAIDTSQLLGLVVAGQALKDAGYGPGSNYDRNRASVILGVTGTLELVVPLGARLGHPVWRKALKDAGVDETIAADVVQRIADSYVEWQENSFPGLLGNVVAGRISKHYDLGGTNCVVDAACASSLSALHLAAMELNSGKADLVVTGGIDTFNDIFMYMCFSKTPALSPTGDAKPFDASGDGTILGEGLGIVVVKRLADAERDGDRIYAVIRGIGSSSDGKGDAIYAPSAAGQKKALLDAYSRAGVTPESIGMIEAHGTGTKVGDAVEVSALREVYGEADTPWCALGSVKSQIGHTKASAGAAGLIKSALALHHKVLPPTIKVEKPLKEVTAGRTPFYITTQKRPWLSRADQPRRAAVSAFGFGGSNFHVVLEEYKPGKEAADWDGNVQIIPLSATSADDLQKALEMVPVSAPWAEFRAFATKSRAAFDSRAPLRLAMVVERGKTNIAALVGNARSMLGKNAAGSWNTPDGTFFARGAATGKLGMLFPGQGAQYTGMLRDLACHFPQLLEMVAAADQGFSSPAGGRLSDLIYPPTPFDGGTREKQESALRATEAAQPAIGAVSAGAFKLLQSFGLNPDAVAGHSYGELTALYAAGCMDDKALHQLSRLRGRLMGETKGEKGSMLAVSAPLETIEQLLAQEKIDLVLANRNAPTQGVLSGKSAEIDRAADILAGRGISCKKIPVAAAFHSPLVADAAVPFQKELASVTLAPPRIPVYANTTAAEYPVDAGAARKLLAEQLANPVQFVAEIEAMHAAGVRAFVEVGPGARLTGLVKAILGDGEHLAVAIDSSNGKRSGIADLARLLAQLAVLGYTVRLPLWDESYQPPVETGKKPAMTVPICGANYVKPKAKRPPLPRPAAATMVQPVQPQPVPAAPSRQEVYAASAAPVSGSPEILAQSLQVTRESLAVLQKMQEETAQLHRRFLEGQEAANRTFQTLLEQQQRLVQGSPLPTFPQTVPATMPAAVQQPQAMPVFKPAAPPAPAPTAAVSPAPALAAAAPDRTAKALLAVVSEKTGYPVEMLEMEMGMDADLGIDSIKRVEILSAIQERLPGAPVIGPEHLGTLRTLGDIARYLSAGSTQATAAAPLAAPQAPVSLPGSAPGNNVAETLLAVVSEKTGYPVEMLEMEMGMDADLGIDSIKRVEILSAIQERLPGAPVIGPEHLGTLRTLGDIARYLSAGSTQASAAAPLAAPQAPVSLPGSAPGNDVAETLLAVVSEKTGYPVEMLEMEMGMDADLGIDSIKRVEILSAIQERLPGAPVIGPEHLGTLRTLGDIARYLSAGSTQATAAAPLAAPQAHMGMAGSAPENNVAETLLAVVSEKTGYPVEMLEMEMGMDADLGIDSIKRVEILSTIQERLPGAPVIGPEHLGTLKTLGEIAGHLAGTGNAGKPASVTETVSPSPVEAAKAAEPEICRSTILPVELPGTDEGEDLEPATDGEFWVTDDGSPFTAELCTMLFRRGYTVRRISNHEHHEISAPTKLAGLVISAPGSGTDCQFLENSFMLLKSAAPALRKGGGEGTALFATISCMDGAFGCGTGTEIADPLSGGLAGFTKTAAREWPEVVCKAIDVAGFSDPSAMAGAVTEELFRMGPVEVGLTPGKRVTLQLAEASAMETASPPLRQGEVVVITGGGRGVTAETAVALSRAFRPFLVLLGRSPEPAEEPSWLTPLTEEAQIKKGIIEQAGGKLHPRDIEERYRAVLAARELRSTLARIEAAGGTAVYHAVDIRDAGTVRSLLNGIRQQHGPIRGLVHGAGVLADRLIVDKSPEQFAEVYGTKVEGLQSLLAATTGDDLRFMALFSSTTGRFGRIGQVDYAVANEVLNKLAQHETRKRTGCRVVAINWGPWDGGMVTPSLKKVFAGEGIGLIGLAAGGDFLVREVAATGAPVEIIAIAGAAGELSAITPPPRTQVLPEAFALNLSIGDYPFLRSHVLDGKAVLPMAVIVEWLAHGALHGNPGLRFHGFNDLRICKGVVFDQGTPCTLHFLAGKAQKRDSFYLVPVELTSVTAEGKTILHARAEIILAGRLPEGIRSIIEIPSTPYEPKNGRIYDTERLFHGPELHGIEQVIGCSTKGIAATVKGAPSPAVWISHPLRSTWLTDPLVMDSAFQLMILWSFERFGAGSLPCFAGRYRQFVDSFPAEGVQIVVRVTEERKNSATADMEFHDRHSGKLVARLEGYECIIDPSLKQAFQRNQLPKTSGVQLGAA
jgi:acyl transferase domain-containing protein/NAD(P)-dependent dehydrogenase (short-subunit alcohol dehydrogenase family)